MNSAKGGRTSAALPSAVATDLVEQHQPVPPHPTSSRLPGDAWHRLPRPIGVLTPASPASADHPGYEPSFRGQFVAVATANGVECWVAEGLTSWLFWNAIECPEDPVDEVEDAASSWAVELGTLHVLSRTERFERGHIATGADAATLLYDQPYALPPGYMANRTACGCTMARGVVAVVPVTPSTPRRRTCTLPRTTGAARVGRTGGMGATAPDTNGTAPTGGSERSGRAPCTCLASCAPPCRRRRRPGHRPAPS
jgi:hypothetical protein